MDAFTAIAEPTRRGILEMLGGGPRAAGEIAAAFEISAPAISQHLNVLRAARLIEVRAEAQKRIYSIDATGMREVDAWVAQYRKFWSAKLDVLEQRLCEDAGKSNKVRKKGSGR
jgi:DNA-binding transcriptional ArsR family regulator